MQFTPLSPRQFESFHRDFSGMAWETCAACKGKCERHTIASLLPGEVGYIAASMSIGPEQFIEEFVDYVQTKFGLVEVIKLQQKCPFIGEDFRCLLGNSRAVSCAIYPVTPVVSDTGLNFELDPDCPITKSAFSESFVLGIPVISTLLVGIDWWRAVHEFDQYYYDFNRCNVECPRKGPRIFDLAELLTYTIPTMDI